MENERTEIGNLKVILNFDKTLTDDYARDSEKYIRQGNLDKLLVTLQKHEQYLKFNEILIKEVENFENKKKLQTVQIAQEHFAEIESLLVKTTIVRSKDEKARTFRTVRDVFLWWVKINLHMTPEFSQMAWKVIVYITLNRLWLKK